MSGTFVNISYSLLLKLKFSPLFAVLDWAPGIIRMNVPLMASSSSLGSFCPLPGIGSVEIAVSNVLQSSVSTSWFVIWPYVFTDLKRTGDTLVYSVFFFIIFISTD